MIKIVVFDWNGTLLADAEAIVVGVNAVLKALGQEPITVSQYRQHYDTPLVKTYEAFGISREVLEARSIEFAEIFHATYEPRVLKTRTRAGTRKILALLHKRGVTNIILSNHTTEGIYLQLERLKLRHYFDAVLANETLTGAHFKSKETRLHDYLALHHVDPSQVAIVGDTIEEVRIGRKLGFRTVIITGGYNSTPRLRQARPDFLIHKLIDLAKILEES